MQQLGAVAENQRLEVKLLLAMQGQAGDQAQGGAVESRRVTEIDQYLIGILLGDRLVGRVDLKADRGAGVLRVQQLTWEPGRGGASDRTALEAELHDMARWLALAAVAGRPRQDSSTSSQ